MNNAIDYTSLARSLAIPVAQTTNFTLANLVALFIGVLLYIAGALAVIYLIYAGILYITAGGNPEQAKRAQVAIISAVIGIVVIGLSFVIFRMAINLAFGRI